MEIDPSGPDHSADAVTLDRLFGGALRLLQPSEGHRAGTDAVLLAASVPPEARRIVDLGAASGIVGLRAAQLNPEASVTLVERETALAELARRNVALNALDDRVHVLAADVLTLSKQADLHESFDFVLTNPPYLESGEVRISSNRIRAAAHVLAGSLDDWVRNAAAILAPKGTFVMIHRADALEAALAACSRRFGKIRLRFIQPRAETPAVRLLISGSKGSRAPLAVLPPLVLHDEQGGFLAKAASLHTGEARL